MVFLCPSTGILTLKMSENQPQSGITTYELGPEPKKVLSRRQFLKLGAGAAAGAAVALAAGCTPGQKPESHATGPLPTPVPPEAPTQTWEAHLVQLAKELAAQDRRNNFEPTPEFTRPFFEQVQCGTVVLGAAFPNDSETQQYGTGWVARIDDSRTIIVTARHVAENYVNHGTTPVYWNPQYQPPHRPE